MVNSRGDDPLKHFNIVSVDLEGWTDTRNGDFSLLVPIHPPPPLGVVIIITSIFKDRR